MSLVFLSINLFALVNYIQFFNSEVVQMRGKAKALNKEAIHIFEKKK